MEKREFLRKNNKKCLGKYGMADTVCTLPRPAQGLGCHTDPSWSGSSLQLCFQNKMGLMSHDWGAIRLRLKAMFTVAIKSN